MTEHVAFLMKDIVLFSISVYLLRLDVAKVLLASGQIMTPVHGYRQGHDDDQIKLYSGGCAMTTIELFPADIHNQKTI